MTGADQLLFCGNPFVIKQIKEIGRRIALEFRAEKSAHERPQATYATGSKFGAEYLTRTGLAIQRCQSGMATGDAELVERRILTDADLRALKTTAWRSVKYGKWNA